jgi:hypothetical protein
MAAGNHDIKIDQGSTYNMQIVLEEDGSPIDLSNYTFASQIRKSHYAESIAAQFNTEIVNGPLGAFNIYLTDIQSAALDASFTYVYDVEITSSGGSVTRVIEGTVSVNPEVTR